MEPNLSSSQIIEERRAFAPIAYNPLPRAVTRHNFYELLDGEWRFDLDPEDRGLRDSWQLGHEYPRKATWPGSIESHMSEAREGQTGESWRDNVIAWYEREFRVPDQPDLTDKSMFQITFGACGYETRVWLNGHPLKTIDGADVHYGEYTSFSYELPEEFLNDNVNRLTVRIQDSFDADLPRGKQESHIYKRGGIWYQTYTGAVRSIWLEVVERNRLRSRIGAVATVEDRFVRFNVTTRIHDPGEYTLRLSVYERDDIERLRSLASADFPLRLEAGQKNQRVSMEVPNADLWSPEEPNLYLLLAELIDTQGHSVQVQTHFGLRKIEARGCCVFLNNKSIYFDGILYQPGAATYDQMRKHLVAIKKLGCNLVRVHIAGIDPRIYRLADEIGLIVWVEVPSPHSSTQKSRANHHDELMRMLAIVESHPSICIWSLYNEDWGAQDIATNPETRRYIVDTYHFLKVDYPQFLVVDNDGWHHISWEGRLKSDLFTVHLYLSDIEKWREYLDKLVQGETNGVAAEPLIVGDPYFLRGEVPIVISEWGGFGFPDYGGPKDNAERAATIAAYKKQLRTRSFAGDVYTQATDVEDERNGLIEMDGDLRVPDGLLSSG